MKQLIYGATLVATEQTIEERGEILFLPNGGEKLLAIVGTHWKIRAVSLYAFSDDSDMLTKENEYIYFYKRPQKPIEGNIFFLDHILSGESIFIASESPDFVCPTLTVSLGEVRLENGGNAVAIGWGKTSEIESICRAYYRNAIVHKLPQTMSNTWGDRHGTERVCRDFVLREIEAAKEIGVDIVQVDDGWQIGQTASPNIRNELGRRCFRGDFWEVDRQRFPNGMEEIGKAAREAGRKFGIWFAPDSENNYALLERDIAVLKRAYDEWGVRFFKLDMYWIDSNENRDQFLKLLNTIYSFGDDVSVQLDVTRDRRINYLCGKEYGSIFVENRYTKSANSYPYRILRSLWGFSKYLPTIRLQFELVNPDLCTTAYAEDDVFAPSHYGMDYLFATVMLSNPLFWMELQFLPEERRRELAPVMKVWQSIREDIATADVSPLGERPDGRSLTGFAVRGQERSYLLLFRELTDRDTLEWDLEAPAEIVGTVISNTEVSANTDGNRIRVRLADPRGYALIEVKSE